MSRSTVRIRTLAPVLFLYLEDIALLKYFCPFADKGGLKMKIMIVDDEPVSRRIMAKTLAPIGKCTITDSGKKAIVLFEKAVKKKAPFELIILDISMPDISGIQVLNQIRTREKNLKTPKDGRAKIIMVTASMRRSVIRKCIRLGCNSYIAKPYNRAQIFRELERLGFTIPEGLKKKTDNKKSYTSLVGGIIKRFNSGEIELPVLPRMVQEVQNLLKSSDPSIEELADIITKDAVISTRLIAIANSSLYKGVDAAKNLNAALLRLGLEETLNVITTLTNKNLYKSENVSLKKLLEVLWMHSFACACCARFIEDELTDIKTQGVFLMGIIHDIGKVLLLKAIADISPDEAFDDKDLQAAIHEAHTLFGAVLIKKWGLAETYIKVAELHHWNTFPENTEKELIIVHLANLIVNAMGYSSFENKPVDMPGNALDDNAAALLEGLGITCEKLESITKRITEEMESLSENF